MSSLYDSYINLVEIGRGGMATVYRATSKETGQLVAIKVLDMHLMNDPAARARFAQEASFTLTHPNIVKVIEHDVDSRGSTPYIVMEYVAGESLEQELQREGKQPLSQVLPVLKDIANALDYAHSQGIIHRDVKPNNMLIRATTGQAMLADFGIAKTASLTAYTQTLQRVGSVLFMSPEQASGAPNLTSASDIYSLGVSTYYALTGRHPFEGEDQIAVARMHIDAAPPHLSDLNPNIPREWGDAVMQTLNKLPSQRPATASEFIQRLESAMLLTPTVAASAANAAAANAAAPIQPPFPRLPSINNGNGNGGPKSVTSPTAKARPKAPAQRPMRRLPAAAVLLAGLIGLLLCAIFGLFSGLLGGGTDSSNGIGSPSAAGSSAATTTARAVASTAAASSVTGTAAANGLVGTATSTAQTTGGGGITSTGSPTGAATGQPATVTAAPQTATPSRQVLPNETPLIDYIDTINRPGAPTRAPATKPSPAPATQPPFVTVGPIGQPTLIVIGASPMPPTPLPPTPTSSVVIYPTSYPTVPPFLPPTPVFPTRTPFPPSPTPLPTATATSLPTATPTPPPTAVPTETATPIPPSSTPEPTATTMPTPVPPTVEPTITIVP